MSILQAVIRQAAFASGKPALITPGRTFTYGELLESVRHLAARLAFLGVLPGDVVALATPEWFEHIQMTLAVAWVGAISMPRNIDAALAGESYFGVKFYFHSSREAGHRRDWPGLAVQMSVPELAAQRGGPEGVDVARRDPAAPWRIAFSSGTTGRPKAIEFSGQSATWRSMVMAATWPLQPRDRVMPFLSKSPMLTTMIWLHALRSGAALVASGPHKVSPLTLLREQEVSVMFASPAAAMYLAEQLPQAPGHDRALPSLRLLVLSGAKVSPVQHALVRRTLCERLIVNFGASEAGMVAQLSPSVHQRFPHCAGRILNGVEVEAVGEHGEPLAAGKAGLLRVRSPGMASGYLVDEHSSQEDRRAFRDGWFYSKDLGHVNADGLLFVGGRADDVINLGGNKIDPDRIEGVLTQDPQVIECAVLVGKSRDGTPKLVAAVVTKQPFDEAALRAHCAARLARAFVPAAFWPWERLPRNEAGKVMRAELAQALRDYRVEPSGFGTEEEAGAGEGNRTLV